MKKSTLLKLLGIMLCVCMLASFVSACNGDSGKSGDSGTAATPTPAATTDTGVAATKTPATAAPEYGTFEDVYIEDDHNIADEYGEIWSTSNRTAKMSSSSFAEPGLKNLGATSNADGTFDLPLCSDGQFIEVWITIGSHNGALTNFDENETASYIQELIGLDIVYIHPTYGQESTEFGLMVASGDWPDIARYDFGENKGESYVNDGIYYDMQYMIRDWMPNYRWRVRALGVERDAGSDSGRIWRIYYLDDPQELPWQGLATRTDMMTKAGVTEYPETLDEWEDLFALYQSFYGEGKGTLYIGQNSGLGPNSEFLSAWNVGASFYDENGTTKYGPLEDNFKEYLKLMKDWYDKGYIDPDFAGRSSVAETDHQANTISTTVVSFGGSRGFNVSFLHMDLPEDFWLEPVVAPVMNKGDIQHFRRVSSCLYNCSVVMGDTEKPVLVAKYYDWLFTDDGALTACYGEYGKCWVYNSDGLPDGTDYSKTPPTGTDMSVWKWKVNLGWQYIGLFFTDWSPLIMLGNYNRNSGNDLSWFFSGEVWGKAAGDYVYPTFTSLTAEESSEYAKLYTDIETYVNESVPQFIIGLMDIEEFDTFRDTLKTMGIERCIELKQAAYDRYWARG